MKLKSRHRRTKAAINESVTIWCIMQEGDYDT